MEYLLFWQNIRNALGPGFEAIVVFVSDYSLLIAGFLSFIIFWVVSKEIGYFSLMNFLIARVMNGIIKVTACIYRPWVLDSRIQPSDSAKANATGYSFPSGHVTAVTSTFGSIAISIKKHWLQILLVLWILIVCITRNYLGVHTLQDVLVGLISTGILLCISKPFWKWLKENKDKSIQILLVVLAICIVAILYTLFKSYPVSDLVDPEKMQKDTIKDIGGLIGFSIGMLLENKYVHFHTDNLSKKQIILRLVLGLAIIGYMTYGLGFLSEIFDPRIGSFISQFLYAISGTFLAPLLFTKIESKLVNEKHVS